MERKVTNIRSAIRPNVVAIMTEMSLSRSKENPNNRMSEKRLIIGFRKSMIKTTNPCRLYTL